MPVDAGRQRLRRRAAMLVALLGLAMPLAAGCQHGPQPPAPEPPEQLAWREVTLPMPAGPAGRLAVRDATACGGRWYVVGAVRTPEGATRPAAWASGDGQAWSSMRLVPRSTYGQVAVLYAAGCRDGALAAIGAQNGGAHGNPRVTQWRLSGDPAQDGGVLDEVPAGFELYGGPDAVNVGRIAGGPAGWLIAGIRVRGAAVWLAGPAAADFRLVDRAPGLASDGEFTTEAIDAAAYQGGWVVVGDGRRSGRTDSDPLAWTSADGLTWRRTAVAADDGGGYRVLQRVVAADDGVVATGVDGDRFGAWRLTGGQWRPAGRFGTLVEGAVQLVQGLAQAGGRVWAAGTDGRQYGLWASSGGAWRQVQLPLALAAASADRALAIAGAGASLLLVADDGRSGRAWLAR